MEQGLIFIADELNLATPDILGFLAPILAYPEEFPCPYSGKNVEIKEGFAFIGAQNPPEYAGRTQLPDSVSSQMLWLF